MRPLALLHHELPSLCAAILGEGKVPGASVAVVANGRSYHHAYGVRTLNSPGPVTIDTSFNIGSCSKSFVSATIACLVAEGLCAWDDPVQRWVPEFKLWDAEIGRRVTLRDLSANRLGLPRVGLMEFAADPLLPVEWILERLQYTQPEFPFRDRYAYLNPGHSANAVAAGRITGKGFLETLRERIFAPLRMHGSSGGVAARHELKEQAGWHVVIEGVAQSIETVYTDHYTGSGGLCISGRDALQWLRFQLGAGEVDGVRILARDALLETHRPHSPATPGKDTISCFYPGAYMAAYALGWAVSDFEGEPLVAHSGSDWGVNAMTILLPRSNIGVAVYGNSIGGGPATLSLAYAIVASLQGHKPRDWMAYFQSFAPAPTVVEPAHVPSPELHLYEGCYESAGDGPLQIRRHAGGLRGDMTCSSHVKFDLLPLGEHRFLMVWLHPEMQAAQQGTPWVMHFEFEGGRSSRAVLPETFAGRLFLRVAKERTA